ncbi:uncharacterized protein UV8b_03123 [Ustilaginoidea virens]|uniref:Queuine tRNA-ribosyltransferase accessory subunit 2 n=1 Tax=Ustilaginoidea virens TaxID=1159556 RepID=A0A8E5HP46_USTVR|nr:uncharacterized protein UV8b_03123 [Ustilaginoidea virens]QUC18882.1 hypothetical protein UV8b_03123 [Ustilaginoidea virens]
MSATETTKGSTMPARKVFELLGATVADGCAARLGRLSMPGRRPIDTPNYTAVTSRGAVPHLTPDNVSKHTGVGSAYMALEDFVERQEPPIYNTPSRGNLGRLHGFAALAPDTTVVLGARRCPPVITPMGNGAKSVTLFTSTGFAHVTVSQYVAAVRDLQPDVVVPLADSLHTSKTPSSKKLIKMVERTEEWVDDFLRQLESREGPDHAPGAAVSVFAPVLPVELPIQWDYLRHLAEDVAEHLAGLAVYDAGILPELQAYEPLRFLPRLSLDLPKSPHDILRQVSLGVDLCALPFVNSVSDAGVALTFVFPAPPPHARPAQPLAVDMWSEEHNAALAPLQEGCRCFACSNHHRAYVRHCLNAKEMVGWNLLQMHNHYVVGKFFEGIRSELARGLDVFEESRKAFLAAYEPELPEGTGARPRARGYHFKSEAGQAKINKSTWVADFEGGLPNGHADQAEGGGT